MFYYDNTFTKCFKKLRKIYNLTKIEQINITINDHRIDEKFNENEYILFYFNAMGTINLKQKKFMAAEFFYKSGIAYYKQIYKKLHNETFDFSVRLNYIYMLKYNLALCYFFQKKYEKSYTIFKELIKSKNQRTNIFLWYRFGLCCLETELLEVKSYKAMNSKNEIRQQNVWIYYRKR